MDLSASSVISTTGMTLINSGNLDPIASERWNVEKKRLEIDAEIEDFYNSQISKSINIENISNKKAMKLYNDIFYKVKWAVPPIPTVHGRLIIGYCGHLLNVGSKTPYPNELDMMVWLKKSKGTKLEKVTAEVHGMCNRMFKIIDKRDSLINKTQSTLLSVTEKMNIKKDGTLRFMMENNHNSRDEYFSLWFLAIHNKHRELEVLLNSTTKLAQYAQGIDTLDPDFQLSALHYGIKHNHPLIINVLLKYNANILLRAPDGRTVLHYAAAYSTREVVLDLLSRGIDYTATDHYNCTALDLARQNANKLTIPVLTNWTSLVPNEQASDVFYPHSNNNNNNNNNNSMSFVSNINDTSMLEDSAHETEHGLNTTAKLNNASSTMNTSDNHFATTAAFQTTNQDPNLSYYSHLNENSNYQFLLQTGPSLDSSLLVHVPDEYSVTPQDTISRMSPMLRLLTKRLEACNKYNPQVDNIDSSEARSRRPESSSYFLSRSVTSINHIANSMSHSMSLLHSQSHGSIGIGFTQQSEIQLENSEVQGVAAVESVEGLLVKSVTFESPLNAESTAEVQSDVLEINGSDHSVQSVPYDVNSAQYNSTLFQTNNRVNAAEQNRATLALIENEVNECQVEIRQCSKHYHLCVQEGFLTEALRSLKRRWLVAKELLVLHQRRQECLQLEWEDRNTYILCNDDNSLAGSDRNDFREQSIGLGDRSSNLQQLPFGNQTTNTYRRSGIDDVLAQVKEQQFGHTVGVSGTGTAESNGEGNNAWEDDLSASIMVIDDDVSSVNPVNDLNLAALALTDTMNQFIVATDEEESVLNLTANAKEERIDLDRLALNFHKSLKRVMYVPELTAAPSDTHHLQDNSLVSTAGDGQYFLAENSMESDKLLLPTELDAGVSGSSADYSSSNDNNIDSKQSKVMYIGSEYESAAEQPDNSKPPLASYVAPDTDTDMPMSADHRKQIASNLSKDVLQYNANANIYYEAAQYVSAVKTEQHVTALDIILSINDQARKRKIIYRRDDSSTAASTTLPASQKWHREDALSISTRDDSPSITTLTIASSTLQFSDNNNNNTAIGQSKKNKISVSYLLQLGLELVDVLTARKEEGIAIRVLEECCVFLDGDEIDSTLKIKLIALKCDLLQFIYHYLYEQLHLKSSPTMREFETHRAEEMFMGVQYIPTIEIPAGGVAESMTLSGVGYKQLTGNVLAADEQVNNYGSVFSADLPGAGGDSVEQNTQSGHFSSNAAHFQLSGTQSHRATHTIPTASMEGFVAVQSQSILSVQEGSDDDASGERSQSSALAQRQQIDTSDVNNELRYSNNDHNNATDNTSVVSDHQQLQESLNLSNVNHSSVVFLDESADNSHLHFASQDTQPQTSQAPTVMEQVLLNIAEVADHSIELHYQLYGSDIFEPYTLSQALQAIAFVQEYSYRGLEALIFMQHAEIIARRALGGAAEETIKVALEALRLFVKYHLYTKEDLRYVDQKSAEINRHISAFSHVNLPLADTFTKKCTELMALATVTILDPNNNTIGSTRGMEGKKRGKVTAFESANKTIRKRYATSNSRTKL